MANGSVEMPVVPGPLHWSFRPEPELKGSYYRRIEDIWLALERFGVDKVPRNSPAEFIAYWFACEKFAKAIDGIGHHLPAETAFLPARQIRPRTIRSAARKLGLAILPAELDLLFKTQQGR